MPGREDLIIRREELSSTLETSRLRDAMMLKKNNLFPQHISKKYEMHQE